MSGQSPDSQSLVLTECCRGERMRLWHCAHKQPSVWILLTPRTASDWGVYLPRASERVVRCPFGWWVRAIVFRHWNMQSCCLWQLHYTCSRSGTVNITLLNILILLTQSDFFFCCSIVCRQTWCIIALTWYEWVFLIYSRTLKQMESFKKWHPDDDILAQNV